MSIERLSGARKAAMLFVLIGDDASSEVFKQMNVEEVTQISKEISTLRNVPPSPSNYAQRAGRAGRSGHASLITVFAGVGTARGPHDQYFYRFPEKMIAGAIAAPRFRLDNVALITAHVRALVLETMGLKGAE